MYIIGFLVPCLIAGYTDAVSRIIPNWITYPSIAAGFFYALYTGTIVNKLIALFILVLPMVIGFRLNGVGGGDVKLSAALGIWAGIYPALFMLMGACILGIVYKLITLITSDSAPVSIKLPEDIEEPVPKEAIPFGSCVCLSAWAYWLLSLPTV